MSWGDLFSGFIGALVGGLLSILGGWFATMWAWERDEMRREQGAPLQRQVVCESREATT